MVSPIDNPAKQLRLVTLDYESYYDDTYSLSVRRNKAKGIEPYTYAEYVNSPKFELQMLTLRDSQRETTEYALGAKQAKELLLDYRVGEENTLVVAHNGRFDHYVTEQYLKVRQWMSGCTILMGREVGLTRVCDESLDAVSKFLQEQGYNIKYKGTAVADAKGFHLHEMSQPFIERYVQYGKDDTEIAHDVAKILIPLCTWDALRSISMSLEMYSRPVFKLDAPLLRNYLNKMLDDREEALGRLGQRMGFADTEEFHKSLRSAPKFAGLLEQLGVEPPRKESVKKTETARKKNPDAPPVMDYAFAKDDLAFKALADHYRPEVAELVKARMEHNSSQAQSRTEAFIRIAERGGGWFPVPLEYCRAHPGRYGGADGLNVQNLPKRKGDKTLRESILPPDDDHEVGGADSSQVEARLLAYAAQEHMLLSVFSTGGDPYVYMAEKIYGIPADKIRAGAKMDEEYLKTLPKDHPDAIWHFECYTMRNVGKQTILGSGYGMSGATFADRLKMDDTTLRPSHEQVKEFLLNLKKITDFDIARGIKPAVNFYNAEQRDDYFYKWYHDFHLNEAKRINRIYRNEHTKTTAFWRTCEWVLSQMVAGESGYFGGPDGKLFFYDGSRMVLGKKIPGIMLPNGYWLNYPGLKCKQEADERTGRMRLAYSYIVRKERRWVTEYIYGGKLTENLIQGLAFALLKWQAVRIHDYVPVKLNVHDEWMSAYPKKHREAVKKIYMTAMSAVPDWLPDAPIGCEFTYGNNYGEC